jgi:regulator of protease activity HflC (stomatin/prohibitin superfamily)
VSKKKLALRIVLGLAGLGLVYSSLVITPFGHRSVIWSVGGVSYQERQPGLSFVVPFVQRYHPVDVREQRYTTVDTEGKANAFVQSSDLQEIRVRASLVYSITPDQAAELFDQVGPEFTLRIVEPIFFDAIKEASGKVKAEAFASSLASIADEIDTIVTPQLAARGIRVLSVALEDAVFDPDFIGSVKAKVIADQTAAEQQRLVAAEQARKEQVILQAQAQDERRRKLGLSPAEYLELLWLEKWNGALPTTLLGSDADVILNGVGS